MFGPNKHKQGTVVKADKVTANKNVSNTNLEKKNSNFFKKYLLKEHVYTYM